MHCATALATAFAASVSVAVGRCGPCCSTLPQGRITSAFFCNCAAISGCVSSAKYRLGNIAALLRELSVRIGNDVGDLHRLSMPLDRAQSGKYDRERRVPVAGIELVCFSGAATFGEHVELSAEHVAFHHGQRLALAVAVLCPLNIEGRALMQLVRRIPSREIDLIVHQAFGTEYPDAEHPRRRPRASHISDL